MQRFTDKRILITGGAGGIGQATAKHFLAEGATVMLVDIDEEDLKTSAAELGGERVHTHSADVTQSEAVQAYVKAAVDKMGGIDVFFNNAGVEGEVKPIVDYPEETFRQVLHVNVLGVWLGLKYVIPHLEKGASIIITSSVAGQMGTPNVSAYVASKHAVIGLMRTAALEVAERGIRVNTVHPSPVDNRMMRSLEKGFAPDAAEQAKEDFAAQIPLQRYATETDVANLVLFLASEEASFLTGGQYNVDGGQSAT